MLGLIVIRQRVQLAADYLILSSSVTTQLAFSQQWRLHPDELPFAEEELQQLVQRQATATCLSHARVFKR